MERAARGVHHGQPVVFTIARGGGRAVMLPGMHDRASPLLPSFFCFPSRLFVFLCGFQFVICFALKKEDVSGLFGVYNS